ncbi:vascular endothelial growth factor receptor 3 [Folsomia candida]|uniref:vascular endothelial growth factor receptor 3 n=1 Tax=Folsomia candida TaxID=158441 RepID=UPI001605281D|nr:vascular endothelial growth factor receptor 3 [Folsomia candida]
MFQKLRNVRNQPCCGYFLQGGVRAVAMVDIGISLFAMILIASELVKKFQDWVDMRKDENLRFLYYVRAILWASYFAEKIVIVGLSVFLFKTARRRNSRLCMLWIYLTIAAMLMLTSATLATQVLFPINALILTFFPFYLAYKTYTIYVVASFIKEIRSYGGFNAALSGLTDAEVEEFEKGQGAHSKGHGDEYDLAAIKGQAFNKQFEISFDQLDMDETIPLGKGAFGLVYRAKLRNNMVAGSDTSDDDDGGTCVAVKTVHQSTDPAYFKTLLAELKIMTFLPRNENVVNLVGACTSAIKQKRLYIVVEFCPFGNVHDYLKARRGLFVNYVGKDGNFISLEAPSDNSNGSLATLPQYQNVIQSNANTLTTRHLLQWCYETAKGMQFLEERKVIHGDLAARNLLLGYGRTIKITDFGLSKKLYQYTDYVKKQDKLLPWRWMALESLQDMRFSSKSDVWGYGVTTWEIFSLGEVPFPGFSWTVDFIEQVRDDGLRMKRPHNAPNDVYELMLETWDIKEEERPNFDRIVSFFENKYNLPQVNDSPSGDPGDDGNNRNDDDEVEVYIGNVQEILETGANSNSGGGLSNYNYSSSNDKLINDSSKS